jgi:cardiolipin synthase
MADMKSKHSALKHIFTDKTWLTPSNLLTLTRVALAPVIVWLLYYAYWQSAFVVFVVAALTDMLDGQLARYFNEQTHLGTLLDPLADKIFLLSSFLALSFFHVPFFQVPGWLLTILIGREVVMLCGSLFLIRRDHVAMVKPLLWGKISTCVQIIFISWLFICYFAGWHPYVLHQIGLMLVAGCAVMSLGQYALKVVRLYS